VRTCDGRGLPLVLDLRQNEGGYIAHATALARLLARAGAEPPRGALLLRANEHNERVFRARAPALGAIRALWSGARTEVEEARDAIAGAREAGDEFTPAFVDPPPAARAPAFGGRVVALVAPTCMSACERLAAQLQGAGALLVGGATEGAGGSQQEAKGLPARWVDASGRLALSVPTAAMGVVRGDATGRTVAPARFFSELALESRPVAPDVPYATTVEDLARANAGWRAAAEAALRADGRTGDGATAGRPGAPGA
jgi:C-terminal processing protease CtpA/Prc